MSRSYAGAGRAAWVVWACALVAARGQDAAAEAARHLAIEVEHAGDGVERARAYLKLALEAGDADVGRLAGIRFLGLLDDVGVPPDALSFVASKAADPAVVGARRSMALGLLKRLAVRAGRFDEASTAAATDGFVRRFYAVGPFGTAASHFGGRAFPPERETVATFDPARKYDGVAGPTSWTAFEISSAEEQADPGSFVPRLPGCVYAATLLRARGDVECDVRLGCYGSAELYVNGARALSLDRALAYLPDARAVRVRFSAGDHLLVVKLLEPQVRSFTLALRTPDGAPVAVVGDDAVLAVASFEGAARAPGSAAGTGRGGAFEPRDFRSGWQGAAPRALAFVRAELLAETGLADDGVRSVETFRAATDLAPGELLSLRRLAEDAQELPESEKQARALDAAQRLAAAAPGHPLAVAALAREELSHDRGEKALEMIEAALVAHPRSLELRRAALDACEKLQFRADAERAALAAAAAYPEAHASHLLTARTLRNRGDELGALRAETAALAADAGDADLRRGVARRLVFAKRFDEAAATLAPLSVLAPHDPQDRLFAAELHREAGRPDAERAALEAAAKDFPLDTRALRRLLDLELAAGRKDAALARAQEILRRDPDGEDAVRRIAQELAPPEKDWFAEYAVDAAAHVKSCPGPEAYPDAAVVLLLDQVVLWIRPDGTATHEVHQIHRLQDPRGRDQLGTVAAQGDVLVVRTLTPDGRTLWPNSLRPGQYEIAGLAKGVVVERKYRYEIGRAVGSPADFGGFYFQDTELEAPYHVTRYVVVVPKAAGFEPLIERFPGKPKRTEVGDDVVWEFALEKMPRVRKERAMPPADEIVPYVAFKRGDAFSELNRRALDYFESETRTNATIAAAAAEAVGDARDPLEKARRAYAYVCERVPTEDGGGSPARTLAERSGPRLPLFAALLTAAGVPWRPCLVRPNERFAAPARVRLVETDSYATPLVRVEPPGGAPVYVTTDLRFRPFGALPYVLCDAPAYVGDRSGGRLERTPPAPLASAAMVERRYDLALDAAGTAKGEARIDFGPEASAQLREQLVDADKSEYEPALLRMLLEPLGKFSPKATGPVKVVGLTDRGGPLSVVAPVELRKLVKDGVNGGDLTPPIPPERFARRFADRAERTHPVVVRDVEVARDTARIALDPTWRVALLPESYASRGAAGSYVFARSFDEATGTVIFERSVQFEPFRVEPADFGAFTAWLAEIDAEELRTATLRRVGP
jgi:hypothetical protein